MRLHHRPAKAHISGTAANPPEPGFLNPRLFRDGPLRRRPPEEIRYGTGKCALGHVLVASSDKGIVSIVVRGNLAQPVGEVRERFPRADLIRDEKGCAPTVARVLKYVAAPFKPFPLALDMRGTELQKRVWEEVRRIPFGGTSTYTKVAEAIGAPKAIRAVASSCARCMHAFAVPCHRVLHKGGDARDANGRRRLAWVKYEEKLAKNSRQATCARRAPRAPGSAGT